MKVLVFGCGSIGARHIINLKALRPGVHIIYVDPVVKSPQTYGILYSDWRVALRAHVDADAAIIASPTDAHAEQRDLLNILDIPYYVEKPLGSTNLSCPPRCAVGFQYRFHPAAPAIAALDGDLVFTARDDLLARYGPHVAPIMAAHPIDTALHLCGPAAKVSLDSNGEYLWGQIEHMGGRVSTFDIGMWTGPRVSRVSNRHTLVELPPDAVMYHAALSAWLTWVEGGERDTRLATVAEGVAVEQVLEQVRYGKQ